MVRRRRSHLKPNNERITIRLPRSMVERIAANAADSGIGFSAGVRLTLALGLSYGEQKLAKVRKVV